MSEPTTKPPALRDLHRAMGALLTLLADVPELHDRIQIDWTLTAGSGSDTGIRISPLTDPDRTLLERVAELLGGGEIRPSDSTYPQSDGRWWRLHTLHALHAGVPVRVVAGRPEPDERTALLARLAELDAAEATAQTGGAE